MNNTINYVKNFSCFKLIKYVAYGVSISMIAHNLHTNKHHCIREKFNQFLSKKDSGHVFKNWGISFFFQNFRKMFQRMSFHGNPRLRRTR
jgi:hypothetical protein